MSMIFTRNRKIKDAAHSLFTTIVAQAREPRFYAQWGVADTLDGRFDLIILHVSLVVDRLENSVETKQIALLIRYLQEVMFANMDLSLREMGVGDMSVGKKVKAMAEAYYGRKSAYQEALKGDNNQADLADAVVRNIFRGQQPEKSHLDHFVDYIEQQHTYLLGKSNGALLSAEIYFEEVK